MQDTKFYEAVLGLEAPWEVVNVELKVAEETVLIEVENTGRRLPMDELSKRWTRA